MDTAALIIASLALLIEICGLAWAVNTYRDQIERKLDQLLLRKTPLNKEQAMCLLEMYLSLVLKEMLTEVQKYITGGELFHSIQNRNPHSIGTRIYDIATKAITNERSRLRAFTIPGDQNMGAFLDKFSAFDGENITQARNNVTIKCESFIENETTANQSLNSLYDQVEKIIKAASHRAGCNLKSEMDKLYKNK
jgi:hypothetical protein